VIRGSSARPRRSGSCRTRASCRARRRHRPRDGHTILGHGAARGRRPRLDAASYGALFSRDRDRHRARDWGGSGARAPPRVRAPRHQAGERLSSPGSRAGAGHLVRLRALEAHRSRGLAHRDGGAARHAALHVAGAVPRREAGRREERRVRALDDAAPRPRGHSPVRAPHRSEPAHAPALHEARARRERAAPLGASCPRRGARSGARDRPAEARFGRRARRGARGRAGRRG
jgi:hypothetical protein